MPIQTLNTIKSWFQTGLKPSQKQFWDTWDSFRHKFEKVPMTDIEGLDSVFDSKVDKLQLEEHNTNQNAHAELFAAKEDKSQKGTAGGYVPLDELSKIAYNYLNIINNLTSGGSTSLLSAEQGVVLQNQITAVNTLLASDNIDLDTIQKIVNTIQQIQTSLDVIFVNDLTTGGTTKALTAEMGKLLETNKEDKSQKGIADGYVPLDSMVKIANNYLYIVNDLVTGGASSLLSAEQGKNLQNQINGINTLLSSDNVNLDTIQEIVDAIEDVQMSLSTILTNDLTSGGITKALTAEMGKKLNETKLTATIATDAETQITAQTTEDNKVVSRSKLFNWWIWIRSNVQTISAIWNFPKGIKAEKVTGNYTYTSQVDSSVFSVQINSIYGLVRAQYEAGLLRWISNGFLTQFQPEPPTQDNYIILPNKSGTVALASDFITTAVGTTTSPSLIIPNGTLTTVPQNGAIERDSSGQLWETHSGVRSRLITTSDGVILIAFKQPSVIQINIAGSVSATAKNYSINTITGKIGNNSIMRLNALNEVYYPSPSSGIIAPLVAKTEVFLKINNGYFATHYNGSNPTNQVLIMEFSGLDNNGFKNYQNPIMTNIQNSNPLLAQWSTIQLVVQKINNGVISNDDATYYLRNADNTRTFGGSEASFSFVFINTVTYADPTNTYGQNTDRTIRLNNYALYLETIR
ncbi:hypothetical protein [Flavobacterium sp. S87F.05.LMB.W.Kidney.N]|uniref:hypothetical protein n=1 Tax=Flavobacterium sp. S87F.05.LMB.W.Kidney.N TaxID=1278758 RepID=UPI001065B7C1|nr:hypothetical protein [Flavobacterium sp. S87F.05.LMB.W.Kidney.N]TDX11213.1 hypothetical protein EDB96_1991 [Flavobacterium sp. S87F.05.LMB.W.Kidney.N]